MKERIWESWTCMEDECEHDNTGGVDNAKKHSEKTGHRTSSSRMTVHYGGK